MLRCLCNCYLTDDKVGSEGCLPSDTNLSGTSTPTPIPVECQGLSVSMPPVRLNISTTGVYQGIEASSGDTETDGCPSDNLSRRHSDYASEQGGADRTNSFDMSTVQGPGFSGQHEEVPFGSRTIDRVSGFSSEFIDNVFDPPSPEATEDPARCSKALETGDCVSKGTGKVPGKGINGSKSSVASSPSLQGTPGNGKCSFAREPNPTRPDTKVQCAGTTNQRSKRGFDLVDLSRQHSNRIPHVPSYSTVDDRIRCIQHRLGSSSRGPDHRGSVVEGGSNTPYQLPGTPSSLSSSTVCCERAAPNNHSVEVGQYNCNDLHQQNGGNTVTASVSTGPLLMGVVSAEGDILSSSASARERECSGRSGVQNSEGLLRLDAEPQCIQANSSTNGSLRGGFVCISPNQTTTTVLQLEAGSRSRGSGCVQSGLVSSKGFANPPWCLIPRCLAQLKRQKARIVLITPLWNTQPWYPVLLELLEDFPRRLPQQADLVRCPTTQEFIMNQRVPDLIAWPISGNLLHHEAFFQRLQGSSCHHGGQRLNPTTTPYLRDGHIGVSKGI